MQFCITNCTCDEAGFNIILASALAHLPSPRDDPKTQMGIAIYWQSIVRDFGDYHSTIAYIYFYAQCYVY